MLAEYLVGLALDCTGDTGRREWADYDLIIPDGIRIEVKSSSYLQSWPQKKPSTISFGVTESQGWEATTTYDGAITRRAHVYVFCVFTERDLARANPLDTRQWIFLVAPHHPHQRDTGWPEDHHAQ